MSLNRSQDPEAMAIIFVKDIPERGGRKYKVERAEMAVLSLAEFFAYLCLAFLMLCIPSL